MGRLAALGLVVLMLSLAGCGQKGPLYLPTDEQAAERYSPRETDRDNDNTASTPDNES